MLLVIAFGTALSIRSRKAGAQLHELIGKKGASPRPAQLGFLITGLLMVLGAVLSMIGCGRARDVVDGLDTVTTVERAVRKAAGEGRVEVLLQPTRRLSIGLVNSPLALLSDVERRAKAKGIAIVGYEACAQRQPLESVVVAFVSERRHYRVFTYRDATDLFEFPAAELSPPGWRRSLRAPAER